MRSKLIDARIVQAIRKLMIAAVNLHDECKKSCAYLLGDVLVVSKECNKLNNLLDEAFQYRTREPEQPATIDFNNTDLQTFRDWMDSMGLLRYARNFEARGYANLDVLVDMDLTPVYEMVQWHTPMAADEILVFMLNFTNIYLEKKHDGGTLNQVPFWLFDLVGTNMNTAQTGS